MAHRALSDILLGSDPPAHAGDTLPATYHDSNGDEQPVDVERLVDLGVAEKVKPAPKPKPAAKAD